MSGHTCPRVPAQRRIPAIHRPPMHAAKGPYCKSTDFTVCAQASPTAVTLLLLRSTPAIDPFPCNSRTFRHEQRKKREKKKKIQGDQIQTRLQLITSRTHTHPSHSQTSRLLTSSLSLGVPVPLGTQSRYVRCVDSSSLVFSLSSHRHSYIGLVFTSLFIDS
jgi:hypothetical protein